MKKLVTDIAGERGKLVRFGLGAKQWLLSQIEDDKDVLAWMSPEGGQSASEIVDHVAWVVTLVASCVA